MTTAPSDSRPSPSPSKPPEDEEDDYMSMTITEPSKPLEKETYTQRRIRKEREAEARSRVPSKSERAAQVAAERDAALAKSMSTVSKGSQMMAKLGYKPGTALGAPTNPHGRLEPIGLEVKEDRGGVGMENEKKRKFREDVARAEKREKKDDEDKGDFRERIAREREEKRVEGQARGAMAVLEGLEEGSQSRTGTALRRPQKVNVLWRGLVRERQRKEQDRLMRYNLIQSLSKDAKYVDVDEDDQDRLALGKEEVEEESDDGELDEFEALEPRERLTRLVDYLRAEHWYCFWCKYKYPDKELEGCPGLTEEDHD